nr:DNA cytosine methyltransferase [Brucella anthropi]
MRELIKAGHIAPGDVDERSIVDIRPSDLIGYTQCHFFAGIGVWSYALRRAGWPDDRPAWTGSCPCQPFSAAGKGAGFTDERHLWPHFHWLIENCHPPVVFGEQVASKDGLGWLDLVQADLEGSGYACGAVDTCAAGFGAPHIRQRLYWVAYADGTRLQEQFSQPRLPREAPGSLTRESLERNNDVVFRVADTNGRDACAERQQHGGEQRFLAQDGSPLRKGCEGARLDLGGLADADVINDDGARPSASDVSGQRREPKELREVANIERLAYAGSGRSETGISEPIERQEGNAGKHDDGGRQLSGRKTPLAATRPSPTNGHWRDADWLFCRDGKWRPVEPGTFPLAHGTAARVGRLRGYGNAIVAPAAQAFIEAYLETEITAANDNYCSVTFRPAA